MNREILFRFWDCTKKEMIKHPIDGITQHSIGESNSENIRPLITINGYHCLPHWGFNCITMQFTGFFDENGVKIFEGDIVSLRSVEYKYYCKFENGAFYLYHVALKDWDNSDLRWGLLRRAFEVENMIPTIIGNIYDNPELL